MTPSRGRWHRRERGFTLIELMVVILGLAAVVVYVGSDFADAEKLGAISNEQSLLEVTMRQVTDYLRQPYDQNAAGGLKGEPYVFCGTSSSSSSPGAYSVPATVGSPPGVPVTLPGGPVKQWYIQVVNGSSADRKDAAGNPLPLQPTPFMDCSNNTFNPPSCSASNCDWGVQELIVSLDLVDGRGLTRTVFKSEAT